MELAASTLTEMVSLGCRVSAKGEGLALRGLFLLLIIPVGLYIIWKRKKH